MKKTLLVLLLASFLGLGVVSAATTSLDAVQQIEQNDKDKEKEKKKKKKKAKKKKKKCTPENKKKCKSTCSGKTTT